MLRRTVSGIILTLLLTSTLALTFNIQPVSASGTIYIRADGSVDPPDAPISTFDNVTYTLIGNITNDADGIAIERSNIIVDGAGYTVQGTFAYDSKGISVNGISNATMRNTGVIGFYYGVYLNSTCYNVVSKNNITNNSGCGVYICNYTETDFGGKYNYGSSGNLVSQNRIANNGAGIVLEVSSNNSIYTNNLTNNSNHGISLINSPNNTLRSNSMADNGYNLGVYGWESSGFVNDFDASNTVDGKSVYYCNNEKDKTVPLEAGYVALVNCANVIVKDLSLMNNGQGILLVCTVNSTIFRNNITNNSYGIYLWYSSNNNICQNSLADNGRGVELEYSSNNTVSGNEIARNGDGVGIFDSSNDNTISENRIATNGRYGIIIYYYCSNHSIRGNNITSNGEFGYGGGIYFDLASDISVVGNNITDNTDGIIHERCGGTIVSGNRIANNSRGILFQYFSIWYKRKYNIFCHNDFIDNAKQVDVSESTDLTWNLWDDGYPSGGNHWSDYTGVDEKSGAKQDRSGSDDIGDTPYVIDAGSRDRYPLMKPWVPAPQVSHTFRVPIDFPTIQEAVDTVGTGDTILVSNGTYYENVVVKKAMSLIGEDPATTIIDGGGVGNVVSVVGDDVLIQNFTVTISGQTSLDGGISVEDSDNVTIMNCNVVENGWFGIRFENSAGSAVLENTVAHNGWDGIAFEYSSNSIVSGNAIADNRNGDGLFLYESSNNRVSRNDIVSNTNGIVLEHSSSNTISGNNINNLWIGIEISLQSSNNDVSGNLVTNSSYYGVVFWADSSGNSVTGNNITTNNGGIWLDSSSNNTISRNNIAKNGNGIELRWYYGSSDYNVVFGNNITGNTLNGILIYQCSNNFIYHNNIMNNTRQVQNDESPNAWDDGYPSGGNYWSDYNGTDANLDGIGDTPYVIDGNNTDAYPLMRPYVQVIGDINDDRTVDIYDAIMLAVAFDSVPSDSKWNSNADFNNDSLIDIFDAIVLASNFGKTG